MKQNKWYTSIPVIVISALCSLSPVFWLFIPLTYYLCYLRMVNNEGKFIALAKLLYRGSMVWAGIGVFYLLIMIGEKDFFETAIPAAFGFFFVPASISFFFGNKKKGILKKYKPYMEYIRFKNIIQIEELCNHLRIDRETAVKDLSEMISKNMIDCYFNDDDTVINNVMSAKAPSLPKRETRVIKCKECGAQNKIFVGEVKECEYCGTILEKVS